MRPRNGAKVPELTPDSNRCEIDHGEREPEAMDHEKNPILPTSTPLRSETNPLLSRRSSTSGSRASRLQDVGDETEDSSKTSTGGSDGLVGSTSESGNGRSDRSASASCVDRGDAGGGVAVGSGSVHWGASRARSGGVDGLGDCARAVGDGQGGGLGDGVGLAVVGDLSRGRADRGVGGHNLRDIGRGSGGVAVTSGSAGDEGSSSSDSEAHFDRIKNYVGGRWSL